MTRRIYFRGQTVNSGELVYGYYISRRDPISGTFKDYIFDGATPHRVINVAQYVGLDKDDRDVYEGDILVDKLDQEHVAEIYDRPNIIAALTLKEALK